MDEHENRRERTAKRPIANVSADNFGIITERAPASIMWSLSEVGYFYSPFDDPEGICPSHSSKYYDFAKGKFWCARSVGNKIWDSFHSLAPWLRLKLWQQALREKEEASFLKSIPIEDRLKIRMEEALKVEPETAEVVPGIVVDGDPYGLERHTSEYHGAKFAIGRFVRRPGSDIWVYMGDLPWPVQSRLGERANNGEFEDIGGVRR